MNFNDTFTEIFREIQKIRPGFTWAGFGPTTPSTEGPISKRSRTNVVCNIPNQVQGRVPNAIISWQDLSARKDEHNHLAKCGTDAGQCSIISCTSGTVVSMCNDTPSRIDKVCADIAPYILDIIDVDECDSLFDNGHPFLTQGQAFDDDGFNIIVAGGGSC
ncbi:hypothetical protein F4819DRAFT_483311 [Hypoxylon fuscum]|nr:hypothetical protein F4819DRAFT_483311 [Hypoxylon fuscum]